MNKPMPIIKEGHDNISSFAEDITDAVYKHDEELCGMFVVLFRYDGKYKSYQYDLSPADFDCCAKIALAHKEGSHDEQ